MKRVRIKTRQQLKASGWEYQESDKTFRKGVRVIVHGMFYMFGDTVEVYDRLEDATDYERRHYRSTQRFKGYHIYEAMTVAINPITDLQKLYQRKEV